MKMKRPYLVTVVGAVCQSKVLLARSAHAALRHGVRHVLTFCSAGRDGGTWEVFADPYVAGAGVPGPESGEVTLRVRWDAARGRPDVLVLWDSELEAACYED